jgi:hypothetical protein
MRGGPSALVAGSPHGGVLALSLRVVLLTWRPSPHPSGSCRCSQRLDECDSRWATVVIVPRARRARTLGHGALAYAPDPRRSTPARPRGAHSRGIGIERSRRHRCRISSQTSEANIRRQRRAVTYGDGSAHPRHEARKTGSPDHHGWTARESVHSVRGCRRLTVSPKTWTASGRRLQAETCSRLDCPSGLCAPSLGMSSAFWTVGGPPMRLPLGRCRELGRLDAGFFKRKTAP